MLPLTQRQRELLQHVCNPQRRVEFHHYDGTLHGFERLIVIDGLGGEERFKPQTLHALEDRELVTLQPVVGRLSVVVATEAGREALG